ncbi:MAG: ROK family protein [Steroidobacteraceae bacterium]
MVGRALNRPVVFLNDADAAGVAEMRWGAGMGVTGTAIMLTFGTGIGSALFVNGKLFPNTELGHLELNGMDAEKFASARVRTALQLDFPRLDRTGECLTWARINALFWPDVIILGGAVSERYAEFAGLLRCEAELRPGAFRRPGRRHWRGHGEH